MLVDEQPLAVPQHHLPGDEVREVPARHAGLLGGREAGQVEVVDHPVVEHDVSAVQAGDHDVLVVARVSENGGVGAVPVGVTRDVLVRTAAADPEFRAHRPVGVAHVQIGSASGAAAEHRIEIQRRRPGVRRDQRVLRYAELGGLIEGDVVVGELADERRAGRHRRVVRIGPVRVGGGRIPVDRAVDDQCLAARGEVVVGIQDAALPADLEQRRSHGIGRLREGRQGGKQPTETAAAERCTITAARVRHRRCGLGGAGQHRQRRALPRSTPRPGRPRWPPDQ
jgi:hypothetical protein